MSDVVNNTASKIAVALLAAQREIDGVSKDSNNPHYGNDFASLTAVIEATVPTLNKHGIVVIQAPVPSNKEGHLGLTTMLLHESGESISGTADVPLQKNDPQGYGSAMTYARRQSLAAMTGLKLKDDDGEKAVGRDTQPAARPTRPTAFPSVEKKPETTAAVKTPETVAAPKRGKTSLFPKVGGSSESEKT